MSVRFDAGEPVLAPTRVERARQRRSVRRFLGLTALGTVVPGAGLAVAGRRRSGLLLMAPFVVALVALAMAAGRAGLMSFVLNLGVRPDLLVALSVGVAVAALGWCVSIVATSAATRPHGLPSLHDGLTKMFTALMCLMVLVPGVGVIYYANIQRDLVSNLFQGGHAAPSSDGVVRNTPNATIDDPWAGTPRVNVLLLGSDSGKDRTGVRTDSMMVASINTHTGVTVLFGIPRNLENVPFPAHDPLSRIYPNGYSCGSACLMNAIWTEAESRRDLFPGDSNPGLTATRDAVSAVLGISIDNTAVIDLSGFQSLVDAMGGVTVTVRERIPIGGRHPDSDPNAIVPGSITGWIEPGRQHLSGYKALWFARSRVTTDDFSRMRRQRCMVGALLSQVNPVVMLEKYPSLAKVAKDNVQVDLKASELPAWVVLVQRIQKGGRVRSLPFTSSNTDVTHPDFAKIHAMVRKAISVQGDASPTTSQPSSTSSTSTPTVTKSPDKSTVTTGTNDDSLVDVRAAC